MMALPVIFAVVLHEVAHGYVAWAKGDDTVKRMGRLTLNPRAHIDPFGPVLLPTMFYITTGFLFAYAKPVPVNIHNLRNPKKDMAVVAAAGPLMNMILATVSAILFKLVGWMSPESMAVTKGILVSGSIGYGGLILVPIMMMLYFSVILNVILAVINLIPIPPADGGRIAVGLLPDKQAREYSKIEPYGLFVLIIILVVNPFGITSWTIYPLVDMLLKILL